MVRSTTFLLWASTGRRTLGTKPEYHTLRFELFFALFEAAVWMREDDSDIDLYFSSENPLTTSPSFHHP
jgi:hypothetical protein